MTNKVNLVLGATSQDGSYLAEHLLKKNDVVVGMKRRDSTNNIERIKHLVGKDNYILEEGDLLDPFSIRRLITKYRPNNTFLLSAQSHVGTSFQQPTLTHNVNAIGPVNCLEIIKEDSPETKLYFASSSETFGNNFDVDSNGVRYQDENTEMKPTSPYAIAKYSAFESVKMYREAYGLFACSGILFNHSSPRRTDTFILRKITKWIGEFKNWLRGRFGPQPSKNFIFYGDDGDRFPKLRLGNINSYRDFGHSRDYTRAMIMMLDQEKPDDYVICSGQTYQIKQAISIAFKHIGIDDWENYIVIDPKFYRDSELDYLRGRSDKAQKNLGWEPQISFEELIKEMVEHDIELAKHG